MLFFDDIPPVMAPVAEIEAALPTTKAPEVRESETAVTAPLFTVIPFNEFVLELVITPLLILTPLIVLLVEPSKINRNINMKSINFRNKIKIIYKSIMSKIKSHLEINNLNDRIEFYEVYELLFNDISMLPVITPMALIVAPLATLRPPVEVDRELAVRAPDEIETPFIELAVLAVIEPRAVITPVSDIVRPVEI